MTANQFDIGLPSIRQNPFYLIVILPSAKAIKALSSWFDPTTNKRSPKRNVV
jgi:hypothetical protein